MLSHITSFSGQAAVKQFTIESDSEKISIFICLNMLKLGKNLKLSAA